MRIYLVATLIVLAACSTTPQSPNSNASALIPDFSGSIVELIAVESDKYLWQGRAWSVAELQSALITEDKTNPVREIRLLQSHAGLSVGQAIDVGALAEAVGAKAFYERDGEFKAINFAN